MQGADKSTPILERLRFLCIASRNLDEFFEVRVAALRQLVKYGTERKSGEGLTAREILELISREAHDIVKLQYRLLQKSVLMALRARDINFLRRREWDREQRIWIAEYFQCNILPVLSPLGLDSRHPFPRVQNKSLNFMVKLSGKDAYGRSTEYAVVTAPRSLPRIVRLPNEVCQRGDNYVFLSSIIHDNLSELFPGLKIKGCHQFRVTMDSNLLVDDEEVKSLRDVLAGVLPERQYGEAVRLEVVDDCPRDVIDFLCDQYQLDSDSVYEVNGPVNLYRLMTFPEMIDRPDLRYLPYRPSNLPQTSMQQQASMFRTLDQRDLLLHHPFDSFEHTMRFLREAATDPQVVAIKQTIYRTGLSSELADILEIASRSGKEVTVIVELSARFDEEANIQLAQRLEQAGAQVLYGVVGHKTHAKMILVVRRTAHGLRRYAHLGTGNYHPVTTRLYTDYGLLTSNQELCEDVQKIFLQIASLGRAPQLSLMYQSPLTLGKGLIEKINALAEVARNGSKATLYAKMNGLTEYQIIDALYEASQAGVTIELLVRGECRLRPGLPDLSENIRIRSIIGRFLEHTRVFYFQTPDSEEMYLSSADWMTRNIHHRVETMFPVLDKDIRKRIMYESFEVYFQDNSQSWELQPDGHYVQQVIGRGHKRHTAQGTLMRLHGTLSETHL